MMFAGPESYGHNWTLVQKKFTSQYLSFKFSVITIISHKAGSFTFSPTYQFKYCTDCEIARLKEGQVDTFLSRFSWFFILRSCWDKCLRLIEGVKGYNWPPMSMIYSLETIRKSMWNQKERMKTIGKYPEKSDRYVPVETPKDSAATSLGHMNLLKILPRYRLLTICHPNLILSRRSSSRLQVWSLDLIESDGPFRLTVGKHGTTIVTLGNI